MKYLYFRKLKFLSLYLCATKFAYMQKTAGEIHSIKSIRPTKLINYLAELYLFNGNRPILRSKAEMMLNANSLIISINIDWIDWELTYIL